MGLDSSVFGVEREDFFKGGVGFDDSYEEDIYFVRKCFLCHDLKFAEDILRELLKFGCEGRLIDELDLFLLSFGGENCMINNINQFYFFSDVCKEVT
jgi:hypothetical protein